MPFTLVGWCQSVNTGNVLTEFDALDDPHIRVEGKNIICPPLNQLLGIFCVGASISKARIVSPSILKKWEVEVCPLNVGAEPVSPPPYVDIFETPIPLVPSEGIRCKMAGTEGAAEYKVGLIWLGDKAVSPVKAAYQTIKATSTTTLTPYKWTPCRLTFEQILPAGRYQVIGMRAQSAGAIAARLIFTGFAWRPGVIALDSIADLEATRFRFGNAGLFGEFTHDSPPVVEFLSVSADTSEEVYLDLVGPL